jgi:hypothetical protein
MDDLQGEICCSVEKRCALVACLSTAQRAALKDADLDCMLHIPPIMLRTNLIRYMVEVYDIAIQRFVIQEKTGEVKAAGEDVESIFGLPDHGLSIVDLLIEEGDYAGDRIPERFLSAKTGNLVIDNLIDDIKKSPDDSGDDFLHRVVLVLIGIVLAPQAKKIVGRHYYAIVEHVGWSKKMNWNEFTRNIKR